MFTISPICVGVIIIAFLFLITYMLNGVLEEDLDRSFFFGVVSIHDRIWNLLNNIVISEWDCEIKVNSYGRRTTMTSKQQYIEKMRKKAVIERIKSEAYQVTPQVYAAFAIVLDKWGFGAKDIADIFAETQELWETYSNNPETMCERCIELTGIDVRLRRRED